MAVYPFYAEVDSSTRKELVGVGCRSNSSGSYLHTKISVRDKGDIRTAYEIRQWTYELTDSEGKTHIKLVSCVFHNNACIHKFETDY